MARFFHPHILMLASLGKSELARQVQYLKAKNEILRARLPKRVTVTPAERRRLLKLGRKIGPAIKHLNILKEHGLDPRPPARRGQLGRVPQDSRQDLVGL